MVFSGVLQVCFLAYVLRWASRTSMYRVWEVDKIWGFVVWFVILVPAWEVWLVIWLLVSCLFFVVIVVDSICIGVLLSQEIQDPMCGSTQYVHGHSMHFTQSHDSKMAQPSMWFMTEKLPSIKDLWSLYSDWPYHWCFGDFGGIRIRPTKCLGSLSLPGCHW